MLNLHRYLEYLSMKVIKIVVPVFLSLVFDASATRFLEPPRLLPIRRFCPPGLATVLSRGTIQESLYIALFLIAAIGIATGLILFLYLRRCMRFVFMLLLTGITVIIDVNLYLKIGRLAHVLNLPFDSFSLFFLLLNCTVVGNMAVFWRAPLIVTQSFLLLLSVLSTLAFLDVPDRALWFLLFFLIIYDIIVVLCPNGFLRLMIEKVQERGETLPGLVYSTSVIEARANQGDGDIFEEDDGSIQPQLITEDLVLSEEDIPLDIRTRDQGLTLGLGDFIFYGVLVTRAARVGWDFVILCMFGLIFGLLLTLVCLMIWERPLPALPFSLAIGGAFFGIGIVCFRDFWMGMRLHLLAF
jgi:hypothetical protein